MTDKETVNRLLENDAGTIGIFFFVRCRAMLAYVGCFSKKNVGWVTSNHLFA